jgi:hypothetical protein
MCLVTMFFQISIIIFIVFRKIRKSRRNFLGVDLFCIMISSKRQEGHDGPEVANLYIGLPPPGRANFSPRAFI